MDRVLVPGVAYQLDTACGLPTCLLRLRRLVALNTGDTPADREAEVFGDPLSAIWERCVGAYLGDAVDRLLVTPVSDSTTEQREAWLAQVRSLASGR